MPIFTLVCWLPLQIETLEGELEDVTRRHDQLKAEMAEESQDPGVKLVASQVAEYKKLKNDAEKKSASLKQKLDRVGQYAPAPSVYRTLYRICKTCV